MMMINSRVPSRISPPFGRAPAYPFGTQANQPPRPVVVVEPVTDNREAAAKHLFEPPSGEGLRTAAGDTEPVGP
jgi:hypothetical protein